MSYLNGGYAPWFLLVGLPLLIHLLTRRAVRPYPLPTFRFLQRSLARQSRLFRLRHPLLLLLRTLLIALLVAVFLKPVQVAPLAADGGRRAAVVVLDTSASMGWRSGGVTSFQKAQALVRKILEGLGPDDRANVILADATPTSVLPQPAAEREALRQAVGSASSTQERCDVPAALALAAEQLDRAEAKRRELYLVSDFQRTNWAEAKFDAVPRATQIVFVGTEDGSRDNTAITAIRLRPPVPRAGDDVTALVEVWNGTAQPRPMPVTFRTLLPSSPSEGEGQTQTIMVPPFATGTAAFPFIPPQSLRAEYPTREKIGPGRYPCIATLSPDGLPDDNTRWFVADLLHTLTVYLLTDEDVDRSPSGSYYVSRALNPTPETPGGIRVLPRRASSLTDSDLRSADVVVLCNVLTLPADRLPALFRYVQNGGALVVFLYGERVQAQMEALNRLAGKGEGLAFLPTARFDARGKGKGYVTFAEARFESRLLRIFKDPSAADLERIQVHRFYLTTEPDERAEVLLKYEDGTPAAARRALGAGSVLLCNFSPAPADSDLARQEVFPPLLHELMKGMASKKDDRREFTPGGAASTTIPPPKGRVTASAPDGAPLPVTLDRAGGGVVLERAERAGLYRITADGQEVALLAVNIHPDESDLRTIDPRELQSERERRPAYLVGTDGRTARLEDLSRNRPLWPYFLLAAFAVLLAEQWVAGMGSRRATPNHAKK